MGIVLGIIISVLCLVIGTLMAFFGYRLHVRLPFLPGSLAGAMLGGAIGHCLRLPNGAIVGAVIGTVLLGFICATISKSWKEAGTFLVFFSGWFAVSAVGFFSTLTRDSSASILPYFIFVAFSVLVGLLAAYFHPRAWVIAGTSLFGAALWAIPVNVIAMMFRFPEKSAVPAVICAAVFSLIAGGGIYVQANYTGVLKMAAPTAQSVLTAPAATVQPTSQLPADAPAADAAPVSAQNVCPNCGMPLKPGAKFCPECGQAMEQTPNT